MENNIKYYYNLKDIEVLPMDNNYLVLDKEDYSYLFYKVNDNIDINNNLKILNSLNKNNKYATLVININNSYITNVNDNNYVLIKLKGIINEVVDLNEIVKNNISYRYLNNKKIDLFDLWSKKIDYLEYQISELSKEHTEVLDSFSFFVGLAENAIAFINVNNINFDNTHKTLSHLRLKNNTLVIDYYNPLNIIIDYDIRDYAEYIKSKILDTDDVLKDIKYILDNANLSVDDIKLFYARLMFPTIYFDKVEDILLSNIDEKELDVFVDKKGTYIDMLKDTYLEIIKKGISIDIPNWIIKS